MKCKSPEDGTWYGTTKGSKNLLWFRLQVTLPKSWLEFRVALQNIPCTILGISINLDLVLSHHLKLVFPGRQLNFLNANIIFY